ncbi:hypothetical protein CFE70_007780 [Pyrenophora teres f. teres 0-1]|uniref:Uncharacterized protein n=1 Tax=Pyrenophora teres f. teres (strain 0-1) TaxID=861557 RepID=E3S939_PYRTT|nr:hypothetical protein PTT_19529 [Pyrenophora teres f. teres 0-1]KAE8844178.1 hypothetical protein HRS9122_05281 [Pyrenophora teres f. teres]
MSTERDVSVDPFKDTYVELASLLPETAQTALVDDDDNKNTTPHSCPAEVTENLQKTMFTEPVQAPVPTLRSSSSITHGFHSNQASLKYISIPVIHSVPVGLDAPITWRECDLMYLLSLLKSEELVANTLVFTPSLNELEHATYPIHLQLHEKTTPTPLGFEISAHSLDTPIRTDRPPTLIAESRTHCSTAAIARRSLAQSLLSNPASVSNAIDRYNVLYTLYTTPLARLEAMYRAMCTMAIIPDCEWLERLAQLRGIVNGQYLVGAGVDENCSVEARVEYYLLEIGRGLLESWIRMVRVCLDKEEDQRAACVEVYRDAAEFLARASDEVMD